MPLVALLQDGEDGPRINQRVSGHSGDAASCGWFREPFQNDSCRVPLGRRYTSPPLHATCAVPRLPTPRGRYSSATRELPCQESWRQGLSADAPGVRGRILTRWTNASYRHGFSCTTV